MPVTKRVRTEMTPNSQTAASLTMSIPPKPVLNVKTVTSKDKKTVHVESEPRGPDYKDYMLSVRDLQDIWCPKFSWKAIHYGWNWAGGHKYDSQYGGISTATASTDSTRFSVADILGTGAPQGWADSIAYTAGSQAWYESLFLPATFQNSGANYNSTVRSMLSMQNVAESATTILNQVLADRSLQTSRTEDQILHYNGGYQKHTFVNSTEGDICYELWELTPRDDITDWFEQNTVGASTAMFAKNVHSYISADLKEKIPETSNYAATDAMSYGTYNTSLGGTSNSSGQMCLAKNDIGFRLTNQCTNTLAKFRVSKSVNGVLEPGATLVYKMKQGPIKMMSSAWNRYIKNRSRTHAVLSDDQNSTDRIVQLVPRFSKLMCIRFYSKLGFNNPATGGPLEGGNWFNLNNVANVPGRVLHTVEEFHAMRAIPFTPQNRLIFKNFLKLDYTAANAQAEEWMGVNDADNTQIYIDN